MPRFVTVAQRTGIYTAECERPGSDVSGVAVHLAAGIMSPPPPNALLVSRTVKDLVVGSGLRFEAPGERALKGVEGRWELFAAVA